LTLFLAVSLLWLAAPVFGAFDSGPDNRGWFVVEAVGIVVALSAAADVVALYLSPPCGRYLRNGFGR
jgi:hypothetical protein